MSATATAAMKWTYVTRTLPHGVSMAMGEWRRPPRPGDLVVGRITEIGVHDHAESRNGRRMRLYGGDLIVGALGNRYATDLYEGYVIDSPSAHLLTAGGVVGSVVSSHDALSEPTRVEIVGGLVGATGVPLSTEDFAQPAPATPMRRPPTLVVVGSGMNTGKTTVAAALIRGWTRAGLRAGAGKVTGSGSGKDRWEYLDAVVRPRTDGSLPVVQPFEVFETAWVLYNLARANHRPAEAHRHLLGLAQALGDDGVGVSREGLRPDADDTALTLSVLHRFGYPISMGPLRPFEGVNFFMTFPLERDPSVTTNAHVLEVLQACSSFPRQHLLQQKLIRFLRDARVDGDHWVDKWHSSPFYATAHAVFALLAPAPDLCQPALRWLAKAQREDGSWGWFGEGSAEETAYAVLACLAAPPAMIAGLRLDLDAAERFLTQPQEDQVLPMFIGKTLYGPTQVVRSAVLAARILLSRRAS